MRNDAEKLMKVNKKPEGVFRKEFILFLSKLPGNREMVQKKYMSGFYDNKYTPDLVYINTGLLFAFELKSSLGKTTLGQDFRLKSFAEAGCICYVVSPKNLDVIKKEVEMLINQALYKQLKISDIVRVN